MAGHKTRPESFKHCITMIMAACLDVCCDWITVNNRVDTEPTDSWIMFGLQSAKWFAWRLFAAFRPSTRATSILARELIIRRGLYKSSWPEGASRLNTHIFSLACYASCFLWCVYCVCVWGLSRKKDSIRKLVSEFYAFMIWKWLMNGPKSSVERAVLLCCRFRK